MIKFCYFEYFYGIPYRAYITLAVSLPDVYKRQLEQHLTKVVNGNQTDWDQRIPLFRMAYRASLHDTTSMTPAKLVFGRVIRLPGDLMFGSPETQSQETQNYSSKLENQLREMNRLVRGRLKIVSDKMKTWYDVRSNIVGFQEGDQVWLFNPKRRHGRSPKLQSNWEAVSYTHLDVYKRQPLS